MEMPLISNMIPGIQSVISDVRQSLEGGAKIAATIPKDAPHSMFLSTGRCGTMSLMHLLRDSNLTPYHSYWWVVEAPYRHKMQAHIQSARSGCLDCAWMWASTRAVEWLGAIESNKPMVGLNHMDTIFAPVFAALHPLSKFVWVHRDPEDVFKSFYIKSQWGFEQLRPIRFAFDPFRYADGGYNLIPAIAWYVSFVEMFARSIKSVLGDRVLAIRSEDLFAQSKSKISEMLDFIGSSIPVEKAQKHFGSKINEKSNRVYRYCGGEEIEIFRSALEKIKKTGLP